MLEPSYVYMYMYYIELHMYMYMYGVTSIPISTLMFTN